MDAATPSASPATVADDLFCVACNYNLRALSLLGNCPECGAAVEKSVAHRRHGAEIDWRRIAWGSGFVCLAAGCLLAWFFFGIFHMWVFWPIADNVSGYCFQPFAAFFLFLGVWCFNRAKSRWLVRRAAARICLILAVLYFATVFTTSSLIFTDGVLLQNVPGIYVPHYAIRQWIPVAQAVAYLNEIGFMLATWFFVKRLAAITGKRWWLPVTHIYVILTLIPLTVLFLFSVERALSWYDVTFDPFGCFYNYVSANEYNLVRDYAVLVFGYWLGAALLASRQHRHSRKTLAA